eukprot:gene25171-25296_t
MLIIVFIVVIPLGIVAAALLREAAGLYETLQAGTLDFGLYFQQVADALPHWMRDLMTRFDVESLTAVQQRLATGLREGSQFLAVQVLGIGQWTVQFFVNLGVMMYLLFFLLRDGERLFGRIKKTVPLQPDLQLALID